MGVVVLQRACCCCCCCPRLRSIAAAAAAAAPQSLWSIHRSFVTRPPLPYRPPAVLIRASFGSRDGGFASVVRRDGCLFFRRGPWKDARIVLEGLLLPARASAATAFVTDAPVSQSGSGTYDASHIQVLDGLEAVRKRPGMYIGSTGSRGLHHLVYEVLDNAIDEAQAGFANQIAVVLFADGSVSVTDNGRGIPTDIHPITKKPALETVLTVLHAGGKFGGDKSGYIVSGGLHGVGLSVVNALSEKLEVTVWRDGMEYFQTYERGIAVSNLILRNRPSGENFSTGTRVKFWPDNKVFTSGTILDYNIIVGRIRELAFLNPEVTIRLQQENKNLDKNQSSVYHYPGGLVEYVQWLNADKKGLHDPIAFKREKDGISLETVLQWCGDVYADTILGYANSIRTSDGGTHLEGAKAAITRTLNNLGRKTKVIKEESLSGEHAREGLTCIVAVRLQNPEFEGQTKTRLGNPEVRKIVEQTVHEFLTEHLELYPATLDAILSKAIQALQAALAARKARELVRQKSILKSSTLPGKLSDCSCSDPKDAEIFIVEGDSAGGSAKQGRDRHFQAILPLRGKILNIERKDEAALYKNEEVQNLIIALGLGMKGDDFKKDSLRYQKIIILTDADVDGAHIRTLLLAFFFRYQRSLFEEGCIYVGVPPLYKVERGKQAVYCYNDNDLQRLLKSFPANASRHIQRFKGLGEMMPLQLWETTMDPTRRILKQMTLENAAEANITISLLMGDKVEPRREFIEKYATLMNLESIEV